jgi:hypothetical protein
METRSEHLAWCKKRAMEYCNSNDLDEAFTSFISDLDKHEEYKWDMVINLGMMLSMGGQLSTQKQMEDFINGTN